MKKHKINMPQTKQKQKIETEITLRRSFK